MNLQFSKNALKKRIAFLVFLVLTILWMSVIFGFSSNDAAESTVQSNTVTEIILRIFNRDFDEMSPEEQQRLIDSCDGIVRKFAHFTAYAILGFLWYHTLFFAPGGFFNNKRRIIGFTFAPCVLFAVTDEYHQTLVDGRAGRFTDVIIDSAGVAFGIIMSVLLSVIVGMVALKKPRKRDV